MKSKAMRRVCWRLKFDTVWRSRSVLDMTICSPLMLWMRVVFSPTRSTVPETAPTEIESPTSKGLSTAIDSEGEQVAQDVLRRQRHRDAADAEAATKR